MKIWIVSDLHYEIQAFSLPSPEDVPNADIMVIAGDFHNALATKDYIDELIEIVGMDVVMVAGNHEFYGIGIEEGLERLREIDNPRLHFLENDTVVLGGTRFVGATLWTDFKLFGEMREKAARELARSKMNDFVKLWCYSDPGAIEDLADEMVAMHAESKAYISDVLAESFDGPTVVVTHHAPHPECCHEKHGRTLLDAAFASDCRDLMHGDNAPDLWISGHTHDGHAFAEGRTKLLGNPFGYVCRWTGKPENEFWQPDLVIDTDMLPRFRSGKLAP
jgi:predicted phosphodiesterase